MAELVVQSEAQGKLAVINPDPLVNSLDRTTHRKRLLNEERNQTL
jgi:hypothetical protein